MNFPESIRVCSTPRVSPDAAQIVVLRFGYRTPQHSKRVPRRAIGELEVAEIGSKSQTDT